MAINRINPGEPIRAEWLNRLVEAVESLGRAGSGGGGGGGGAGAGLLGGAALLALAAQEPDALIWVRVVEVHVPEVFVGPPENAGLLGVNADGPTGRTAAFWPSTVTYRVKGIRRTAIDEDLVQPAVGFGRPVNGDAARIHPVLVNTVGVYLRMPGPVDGNGAPTVTSVLGFPFEGEIIARKRCS